MYQRARYLPAGDRAVSIELGDAISPEINRRVRSLFLSIEKQAISGVVDLVPSYRSVLVYYDPLRVTYPDLEASLRAVEAGMEEAPVRAPNVLEVPTLYGGEYGPDLGYVAEHNGLTAEEVVRIHSGTDYLIYMMGFTPGFTYLGGMSDRIATPRLETPRTAIPAGSVGIAETQTGVYPVESPGGWRLIGRTPLRLFDPRREPPVVVGAGDYLRFVPTGQEEYTHLHQQVAEESYNAVSYPLGQGP